MTTHSCCEESYYKKLPDYWDLYSAQKIKYIDDFTSLIKLTNKFLSDTITVEKDGKKKKHNMVWSNINELGESDMCKSSP